MLVGERIVMKTKPTIQVITAIAWLALILAPGPARAQFLGHNLTGDFGLGPEITIPLASKSKLCGFLNARYFWESGNRSTVEGETFVLTLTLPIPSVPLQ